MKIFIQIGTNNGNDNFRNLVIKESPDLVLLVEPNENLIEIIKNNYINIKNVNIINKAVGYEDDKEVSLYIPAINKIYGNKGENNFTYGDAHFSLVPMNDWGEKENMIEIKTKSITFNTLCFNYNINEIDYLQIDTEGFDTEIIKMIDFDKINIKKLRYEKWGFDPSCFTKYHSDKYEQLGKNGLKIVEDKLIKYGYVLNDICDVDGNYILAIKKIFYSQCQEDQFLNENYFKNKKNGNYIELGALDGIFCSNTKFFQDTLNWNGILIEPHPLMYESLKINRPNNLLFNELVSCLEEELNFKFFLVNFLATVSGVENTLPKNHDKDFFNNEYNKNYLQSSIYIKPKKLTDIINLTNIQHFDLLSLDVEGHEYEVLKSWDFSIPIDIIMIEALDENNEKTELCRKILINNGYNFDCKYKHNEIFILNNSKYFKLNLIDNNLFYVKNKDTYPPFKNGHYMEEYFLKYMIDNNLKYDKNNRLYIPCLWTNFQIESWFYTKKEEMQNILDNYILNNYCENGYFTIVQHDDGPKLKLPENTLIYGACNGNIKLPLIYEDIENKLENISRIEFNKKNILCSFIGTCTHNIRYILYKKFINNSNFIINIKNDWSNIVNDNEQNNFILSTINSKFALAPRGYGRSSFRFFEIFKLGTIPIYVWDDIEWLPYNELIDYSKICISININDIDNLENILLNINEQKYNDMICNYNNMKYIFGLEFMSKYIITK
jgi:FkbM family methyltransferase